MIAVKEFNSLCLFFDSSYITTFEEIEDKFKANKEHKRKSESTEDMNLSDANLPPKESNNNRKR